MKFLKLTGPLLLIAVAVLSACKKAPSYTQHIPKDASYVLSLDVKSMVTKLENDSLTVEDMLAALKDSSDPSKYTQAIDMWSRFKEAGIDLDKKVIMAVPTANRNSGQVTIQVLAGLKDEQKLTAFIGTFPTARVTKEGDFSYAMVEEWLVGWKGDVVMMLGGQAAPIMDPAFYNEDSTGDMAAPAPRPGGNDRLNQMKQYFTLEKSESLVSIDAFTKLVGEKGDILIFTNSSSLGAQAGMGLTQMPKVKALVEGIFSTSIIDFEDGKVAMKSNTYFGPKLSGILEKYAGPKVDMDLVDAFPSNNVGGVAAFSFNPQLIPALLQEAGFDAIADLGLQKMGITVADIVKAFKGDFAVMFSDFTINKVQKTSWEGNTYTGNEPSAKLLVAIRVGDKASFEKVLGVATGSGFFTREGNRLIPAKGGVGSAEKDMVIGYENDLMVFSNDEATYQAYVANKTRIGLPDEARSSISGASIAFFIDAQKLMGGIPATLFDSSMHDQNLLAKAKTVFKSASFTTENFDGKKIPGNGQLVMMQPKNSLPQLVRFLMYAAEEMKMKNAGRWGDDNIVFADTTGVPPAN